MSGYPGQKLVLRISLQLSGWRKESLTSDVRISLTETGAQDTSSAVRLAKEEPYFGCQDIFDRNWGSGHLFSCQAGERTAFLDVRISWTEANAHNDSSAVRKTPGKS
jgi:hypothetical protein